MQEEKEMFLDVFDLDGDGDLNAVEMAMAYTVMFGEDAWGDSSSGERNEGSFVDAEDSPADEESDF